MKKGIIGFIAACTLFNLAVVGHSQKVEAESSYTIADSIAVGDTVALVCQTKNMELSGISTTSTKYGLGVSYTDAPVGAYPLTVVAGSTNGTYALKNTSGQYLHWSSGNSLQTNASLSANTSWKITFSNGQATILNGKDNSRKLQWNASSPRFACYTSGQTAVSLYKLVEESESDEPQPLPAPFVSVDNTSTATWNSNSSAKSYTYIISDDNGKVKEETTTNTSVKLEFNQNIKVKANSSDEKYLESEWSAVAYAPIRMSIVDASKTDNREKLVAVEGFVSGLYASGTSDGSWDSSFGNMSVYIEDESGNKLIAYRMSTQVNIGDYVTVVGTIGQYNNVNQLSQGCIATIHEDVIVDSDLSLGSLVSEYVSSGIYTKKTNINLNVAAIIEANKYFHADIVDQLKRTTYYNGNELWMTSEDGSINSGYGTVTEENFEDVKSVSKNAAIGHMTHFSYIDGNQKYDYSVAINGGMEAYYVTPKDFSANNYFDGWNYVSETNSYEYDLSESNKYIEDFVNVVAPLLLNEKASNYLTYSKITIKEIENSLIIEIHLDSTDYNKLIDGSNNVLAKAIITKGNGDIDFSYKAPVNENTANLNEILALSFTDAVNNSSADTYLNNNFPDWTITNKLGNCYGGYLGFGRSGDKSSSITSPSFTASENFTLLAVLKGNGSSGVATSTITFSLLDADGNVIATSETITPVDAKDTEYEINFNYNTGKTFADANKLHISFAKETGNIGLKSLIVQ